MMKDIVSEDMFVSRLQDMSANSVVTLQMAETVVPFRSALLPEQFFGRYRQWGKRMLDMALVVLSLPVVLPILAICAIALWFEGGSPFYSQDRLGFQGKRFRIFKLRTMVRDADDRLKRPAENLNRKDSLEA
ncbi:sugar transferase [Aestuariivita sp.]|uniref:sugar transferase n=1 Tax=Aestuariivita sp. TaxID=1872407 RepID=UPI003BAFA26A